MKKSVLLFFILLLLCCGCAAADDQPDNMPYEPDTPAPAAHDGIFRSEHGSLRFNGDGESIVIDFDSELSARTGLPEGEQEGTYVFLSGDLPPMGSSPVRYDAAHELQITVGEQSAVIQLGIAAEDGSTAQTGVDTVTSDAIPFLFDTQDSFATILFEREASAE